MADYIASTASIFNLLTLSIDRYWSITSPLKYLGKRTKSRALIMIGVAWSISLLWLIPIIGWPYFFNNNVRYVPENKCNTEYNQNLPFKITTAGFNFYLPLIAMICINTKVYLVIRKRYQSPIMKYTSSCSNTHNPLLKSTKVINSSVNYNIKNDSVIYKSTATASESVIDITNRLKKQTALLKQNSNPIDYSDQEKVYRKLKNINLLHKQICSEINSDRNWDSIKSIDSQANTNLTVNCKSCNVINIIINY